MPHATRLPVLLLGAADGGQRSGACNCSRKQLAARKRCGHAAVLPAQRIGVKAPWLSLRASRYG